MAHQAENRRRWLACALFLAFASGCGGGGGGGGDDAGQRRDRSSVIVDPWSKETVATGGVGTHTTLALGAGGEPMVAYYATNTTTDGLCTELGVMTPPQRLRSALHFAQRSATGTWATEMVANVLTLSVPSGLSLRAAPDGSPVIAGIAGGAIPMGGPQVPYCGANDVGLYRKMGGTWSPEIAVMTSGEAATGMAGSDFGSVVGYWPALAFDRSGNPAVAYKDVHSGSIQFDDLARADLEIAFRTGTTWRAVPVDAGMGAGDYMALVFDRMNRPVVVYFNMVDTATGGGLWAARSSDNGATWQKVRLLTTSTTDGPDIALDAMGRVVIAFFDGSRRVPFVATLIDDAHFDSVATGWQLDMIGDPRYDEGRYASIDVDSHGNLGVAYYRCARAGTAACNPTDDALVFAYKQAGSWSVEVVDEGTSMGSCGTYTGIRFDTMDRANIAYQCETDSAEGTVKLARRDAL